MSTRGLVVGALVAVGLLGSAGSATAAITCTYYPPPTGLIDVILSSDDSVRLEVVGGQIQVQGGTGTPIPCSGGTAPTATTTRIDVTDGSGGGLASLPRWSRSTIPPSWRGRRSASISGEATTRLS